MKKIFRIYILFIILVQIPKDGGMILYGFLMELLIALIVFSILQPGILLDSIVLKF